MQLRPETRLRTAVDAMTHVIVPAIDPKDSLAQEQAQLVIGMLVNAIDWLPLERAFDLAELSDLVLAADEIQQGSTSPGLSEVLTEPTRRARELLDQASPPGDALEAVRALRAALGQCVATARHEGRDGDRELVARAILDASRRCEPRTRSAYRGHSFDPDPALPSLQEQLGPALASSPPTSASPSPERTTAP